MPRRNRFDYLYDDCHVHVRLQVNNREFLFNKTTFYRLWKKWVKVYLIKYPSVRLTGYQWMSNHCHLIIHALNAVDLTKFLHDINWRFAFEYNKLNGRKGHFFQSRYRCSIIDKNEYEMACQRYIYQNPRRAGIVKTPQENKWGSYSHYAFGETDELITTSFNYEHFGSTPQKRCHAFRLYVETITPQEEMLWKEKFRHSVFRK